MPTSRPRHLLTESDRVRAALDAAARRWPEEAARPTALLHRLIDEGHRSISRSVDDRRAARLAAIASAAEGLEGVYPPGYLADLRDDWPA